MSLPKALLVKPACSAFFNSSHGRSCYTRYTEYPASHGDGSHQAGGLAALAAIRELCLFRISTYTCSTASQSLDMRMSEACSLPWCNELWTEIAHLQAELGSHELNDQWIMGRVNRIWKLLQNLLMSPCLFSIHQVDSGRSLSSHMWLSVSSCPDKVRNDNLKLLGVHTAADWRLYFEYFRIAWLNWKGGVW